MLRKDVCARETRTPDLSLSRRRNRILQCCATYSRRDSNSHFTDLKSVASTSWATRTCTLGEIRTLTKPILNRSPLPIGLQEQALQTGLEPVTIRLTGGGLYQLSYQSMVPAFPGSHLFLRSDRVAYSDQPIGCRKHELPYSCAPFRTEHDNGLEPITPVWKTGVLPITPIVRLVEVTGVEPVSKLRQILRMLTR